MLQRMLLDTPYIDRTEAKSRQQTNMVLVCRPLLCSSLNAPTYVCVLKRLKIMLALKLSDDLLFVYYVYSLLHPVGLVDKYDFKMLKKTSYCCSSVFTCFIF